MENLLASMLCIHSFISSPLCSVINREQHEKYPYNQFSHNRKYTQSSIVQTRALFIDFKVGVSFGYGFISLLVVRICWTAFQARNNVWSAPAGSALTLVSHRSPNARTENRHLCAKGERNGVQKTFDKTMMWPNIGAAAVGEKAHLGTKRRWTVKKSSL